LAIYLFGLSILLAVFGIIIRAFLSHVILFETGLLFIVSVILFNVRFELHPVFSILISILILIPLFVFWNTKIGFWLLSIPFSAGWGVLSGVIAYHSINEDIIWGIFIGAVAFIIVFALHIYAKSVPREKSQV